MKIAIVNYNAGNTKSVWYALERLGYRASITNDVSQIKTADRVILPGVGHAAHAMQELKKYELNKLIPTLTQPVLGICLGLQLMCKHTAEANIDGMGIFNSTVQKFESVSEKIPQIGWNEVLVKESKLFANLATNKYAYFVHSYYASTCTETIATTNYILPFSAALQKDNFFACQFHPEKSSAFGETILQNFIEQ
jgi:imidazole glycerol-phosphate synthase subunit HisH